VKWNISVTRGKEINEDFISSGERTWKKVEEYFINEKEKVRRDVFKKNKIYKSKTDYVKFCLNIGGPPTKLKYN